VELHNLTANGTSTVTAALVAITHHETQALEDPRPKNSGETTKLFHADAAFAVLVP